MTKATRILEGGTMMIRDGLIFRRCLKCKQWATPRGYTINLHSHKTKDGATCDNRTWAIGRSS